MTPQLYQQMQAFLNTYGGPGPKRVPIIGSEDVIFNDQPVTTMLYHGQYVGDLFYVMPFGEVCQIDITKDMVGSKNTMEELPKDQWEPSKAKIQSLMGI